MYKSQKREKKLRLLKGAFSTLLIISIFAIITSISLNEVSAFDDGTFYNSYTRIDSNNRVMYVKNDGFVRSNYHVNPQDQPTMESVHLNREWQTQNARWGSDYVPREYARERGIQTYNAEYTRPHTLTNTHVQYNYRPVQSDLAHMPFVRDGDTRLTQQVIQSDLAHMPFVRDGDARLTQQVIQSDLAHMPFVRDGDRRAGSLPPYNQYYRPSYTSYPTHRYIERPHDGPIYYTRAIENNRYRIYHTPIHSSRAGSPQNYIRVHEVNQQSYRHGTVRYAILR